MRVCLSLSAALLGVSLLAACGSVKELAGVVPPVTPPTTVVPQVSLVPEATTLKVQVSENKFTNLRTEVKINDGKSQSATLENNVASVALINVCPGDNTAQYSLYVNTQALTTAQTSKFSYLPSDALTLSAQAASLTTGGQLTFSAQLSEKLAYGCEPTVTVEGSGAVTASKAVIEGSGAQRTIKMQLSGVKAGSGTVKLSVSVGAATRSATIPVTVTDAQVPATITGLTAAPNPLALQSGETKKLDVGLTGTGNFNRQLLFMLSDINVAAVSADGIVSAVKTGSAILTVTPVGNPQKAVKVPVTVSAAPSFDITSSVSGVNVKQGSKDSFSIKLVAQNGYTKTPTLSLQTTGVQASATVSTLSSSGATVNVTAPSGLAAGDYSVIVNVTDADLKLNRSITVPINVSAAAPAPDPVDKASPTISEVQPSSGAILTTNGVLVQAVVKDNQAVESVRMEIGSLGLSVPLTLQSTDTYAATWDVSKLESGTYVMEIVASDRAGNISRARVPVDLSRPSSGLTLKRRFQFNNLPTSSVATDASGRYGFVGVGGSVYRLDLSSGGSEEWYTAPGTVRSIVQAGGKMYMATAGDEVYALDPSAKTSSPAGGVVQGGITTALWASGDQVYVGGNGGLFRVTDGQLTNVASKKLLSLTADRSGVYAYYATGEVVSYTSLGNPLVTLSGQNLRWVQASGGVVYGADRDFAEVYTKYSGSGLLASAQKVSPTPNATPSFLLQVGSSLLMGDAGGVLTDVNQSQTLSLNGSLNYIPQSYNGVIYLSTNNYTLYAIKQVGNDWQVAAKMSGIGLATAGASVGADGTVFYVGFNGVYAYKPL